MLRPYSEAEPLSSEEHMPDPITRRDFAELVALAAAAPFVAEGVGTWGSGLGMARPSTQPQAPSPEPSPLARALAESIRVRYDGRLSADDLTTITQGIESRLQGLERLYRVTLTNGDEPDFVFSVYRGRD
jgi:hypothetical protein